MGINKIGLEKSTIPNKVKGLIFERRKDHPDTNLPKIPSAQDWKDMTDEEKQAVKDLLIANGLTPDIVLRAHWPKTPEHHGKPNIWRKR